MMFRWIRARVREAFIAGIQDGIDALSQSADGTALDLPRASLLRLPAADEDGVEDDAPAATSKRRAKV